MAALANLLLLGKEGLRTLLGHAVEMAEVLRELIAARPELTVLNDENVGPVTLFRAYPPGVDTFSVKDRERSDPAYREQLVRHNELNRRIFERVAAEALAGGGRGDWLTDNYRQADYGEPIVGPQVVRALAVRRRPSRCRRWWPTFWRLRLRSRLRT